MYKTRIKFPNGLIFLYLVHIMSSTPDQAPKPTGVERTFACEECGGISFKTSEELRKHDREVHQIN
jgi:hypothetical protein